MGIFGGYKIVDFKGTELSGTPVQITNIYYKAQSLIVKRFVATNFSIDGNAFGETDMAIHKDNSHNLLCEVGAYVFTITPQSMVSVVKSSGISSITAGDGLNGGTITTSGTISLKKANTSEIGGFKSANKVSTTSAGNIQCSTIIDEDYSAADAKSFISKGTLDLQLAKKQNTLTAGQNITIENDVISSTSGGGSFYLGSDSYDFLTSSNSNPHLVEAGDTIHSSLPFASTTEKGVIIMSDGLYIRSDGTIRGNTIETDEAYSGLSNTYVIAKGTLDFKLNSKQNKLIAGSNITLTPQQNGEVEISATGNTTTTSTNASITLTNNNTIIVTNQPTALAITLPSATSGIDYNCGVIFQAGASFALTETAPSGCTIVYDSTPTFTEANIYEINYRYLGIGGVISAICHEVAYE